MSLPGGTANKLGGLFESYWTLRCALRILGGQADWIEIEPIGPAGEGIEFVFSETGRVEQHQVKRARTGVGHWTLAALNDAGVLAHFRRILEEGGHPRFISAHDAHQLHELSDRARAAQGADGFFMSLGTDWQQKFSQLRSWWEWDEMTAFEALTRTGVSTVGEDELDEWNLSVAERYIDGLPARALVCLANVLIKNIRRRLDEAQIWKLLDNDYQLGPRRWADTTIGEQVRQATRDYRAPLAAVRLRNPIERAEADRVVAMLQDGETLGVLVSGPAGAGKSEVIDQALDMLESKGWPTLAFRVDHLSETPRPEGIGEQLRLPSSPVAVLSAVAKGQPSLLVIDQLDAISVASGRLRGLWEPTSAMLQQVRAHEGMRVLLACRQFDLDNDSRLRALADDERLVETIPVAQLSVEQVDAALAAMNLAPGRLSAAQRRIVELPLHLKLLEPLAHTANTLDFTTATGLFGAFWDDRRRAVEARDSSVRFNETLSLLSETMSERRSLSVPAGVLELKDLDRSADVLASEQLLVRDGRGFAFFHEGFFDYTFARYHLARGRRVIDLLVDDEQDLFRRSQVRQVLLQERDLDRDAYISDLRDLLERADVRLHIRQVVLALLREMPDPSADELDVLLPFLDGDPTDPRALLTWEAVTGAAWFEVLDRPEIIARWLSDEHSTTVDRAASLLARVSAQHADRAAMLVLDACDWSEAWIRRMAGLLRSTGIHESRPIFELAVELSQRAPYGWADEELWFYGHELVKSQPAWAAELLPHLYQRATRQAQASGRPHAVTLLQDNYGAQQCVIELGTHAPLCLVEAALPWLLDVAERDIKAEGPAYSHEEARTADNVWGYRDPGERHQFSDILLGALEDAVAAAADQGPDEMTPFIELLATSELDVGQLLLYRALSGNPERFAERAAEILLQDDRRLRCGYSASPYWVTRELLQAVSPELSNESFALVEEKLLGWTPARELRKEARTYRGQAQLCLLGGLERARLSRAGLRRIQELGRKLGGEEPGPPRGVSGGAIQSPIDSRSARHMSDQQWLSAISKHRLEWHEKRTDDLIGGARQLASILDDQAKLEPERFARLGLRIPSGAPQAYMDHLLAALYRPTGDAEPASDESVFALIRHAADDPNLPHIRWICRLVGSRAEREIPADVLAIVAAAASNPDPQADSLAGTGDDGQRPGAAHSQGMNSVRGSAAEAIGQLIFARRERIDHLLHALRAVVADPVAAVRTCAAYAIGGLMRWDRVLAAQLTIELTDTDDRAVASQPVVDLLAAYIPTNWPMVAPIIRRLLSSEHEEARRSGAQLATLAALQEDGAATLLEHCLTDRDHAIRESTAQVLSANLASARYAVICADSLQRLFDDKSPSVRKAAVQCFFRLRQQDLSEFRELVQALLASAALDEGRTPLLSALERSTTDVSELVVEAASKMVADAEALGDIRTSAAADARRISELLVRVLGESRNDQTLRTHALDLLDRLIAVGAWGVVDAIGTVDR